MTISVPLNDDVTATLRAETSACTDSLAPGCCSRLTSSTLLSGVSLATGGGAGGFLRWASPWVAKATMAPAAASTASSTALAFLPGWAEVKQLLPLWPSPERCTEPAPPTTGPHRPRPGRPQHSAPCATAIQASRRKKKIALGANAGVGFTPTGQAAARSSCSRLHANVRARRARQVLDRHAWRTLRGHRGIARAASRQRPARGEVAPAPLVLGVPVPIAGAPIVSGRSTPVLGNGERFVGRLR